VKLITEKADISFTTTDKDFGNKPGVKEGVRLTENLVASRPEDELSNKATGSIAVEKGIESKNLMSEKNKKK